MLLFILAILFGLAALFFFGSGIFTKEIQCFAFAGVGAVICAGLIAISCFNYVPTGYTGIVTTFGRVENITLDAGAAWLKPWQKVIKMDNRVQTKTLDMSVFSSDTQEVRVIYTINYRISKENAMVIYREIGADYYTPIVEPQIKGALTSVFAKYSADELLKQISNASGLSQEIRESLEPQLEKNNVNITGSIVEDFDFTDAYTNAVEAKQVAEQNKLKAKTEQEQATLEEEAAAERKRISAQADADAAIIAAKADAEIAAISADSAEYQGQKDAAIMSNIGKQLNDCPDLIEYYRIQAWDGKLPSTMLGDSETLVGIGN